MLPLGTIPPARQRRAFPERLLAISGRLAAFLSHKGGLLQTFYLNNQLKKCALRLFFESMFALTPEPPLCKGGKVRQRRTGGIVHRAKLTLWSACVVGPKCLREHSFRRRAKLSQRVKSVLHNGLSPTQSITKGRTVSRALWWIDYSLLVKVFERGVRGENFFQKVFSPKSPQNPQPLSNSNPQCERNSRAMSTAPFSLG